MEIFTLYPFSPLSPSLWEKARYRLKYCLKGLLNPKQPTNQPTQTISSAGPAVGKDSTLMCSANLHTEAVKALSACVMRMVCAKMGPSELNIQNLSAEEQKSSSAEENRAVVDDNFYIPFLICQ